MTDVGLHISTEENYKRKKTFSVLNNLCGQWIIECKDALKCTTKLCLCVKHRHSQTAEDRISMPLSDTKTQWKLSAEFFPSKFGPNLPVWQIALTYQMGKTACI